MFKKNPKVALINVNGVIRGGSSEKGLFGGHDGADNLISELHDIANDDKIQGVIIRVNSPGGSAAASQEIYELIQDVRKSGKFVVASMADVAASGGYMIAAGCDVIVASPSTLTGSIGVIFELPYYKEIADKIGYSTRLFKAGKLKDIGNPLREMTDEETDLLQNMVLECHKEFIALVAEGRRMSVETITPLADGRIYTGRQAHEHGLVDVLGNFYTAVDVMKRRLDVDEIDLKEIKTKKGVLSSVFNAESIIDKLKVSSFFPNMFLR